MPSYPRTPTAEDLPILELSSSRMRNQRLFDLGVLDGMALMHDGTVCFGLGAGLLSLGVLFGNGSS